MEPTTIPTESPRSSLYLQATCLRYLAKVGFFFHGLACPQPLAPRFIRTINTTLAPHPGQIQLLFYTPEDYRKPGNTKLYPCMVNFHGGGFTIGNASDDARWATAVVQQADTVVCSVEYRCAPEFPFPTAIEDGADALMWIWDNAKELAVDGDKIGVSGFSAGGNMAITVPLRLQDALLRRRGAEPPQTSSNAPVVLEHEHQAVKIVVSWYPCTDFTITREDRRKTNIRPDRALPQIMLRLFDSSYLHPENSIKRDSPYLSPGVASEELLKLLPDDFVIYTCEWDDLRAEGERFADRLRSLGKNVKYKMVEGVPHGWDKSPNPFKPDVIAEEVYKEACREIKRAFYGE